MEEERVTKEARDGIREEATKEVKEEVIQANVSSPTASANAFCAGARAT